MSNDKLRVLAEAATPGPWGSGTDRPVTGPTAANIEGPTVAGRHWGYSQAVKGMETIAICPNQDRSGRFPSGEVRGSGLANAAYIAAAHPQAILALIDGRDALRKALLMVITWADQRCPCRNEEPNPCPLCMADANNPRDICLSAENTLPPNILREIRRTLSTPPTALRSGGKS